MNDAARSRSVESATFPAHGDVAGAPVECFPPLAGAGCVHAFLLRVPDLDVATDRFSALERLDAAHRASRREIGLENRTLLTAEQIHEAHVGAIKKTSERAISSEPFLGADALVTDRADVCLGIYVADCCAVYFVDSRNAAIGLAHSGKKGTGLGIVPATIAAMTENFGSRPADLIVQLSPCIRPPDYETDFATEIIGQCRAAGVEQVHDAGSNTAADSQRYYSYRREKGRTGRMLALLALKDHAS